MELARNIGPGRGGRGPREDFSKYFSRGFFANWVCIALRRTLKGLALTKRETAFFKEAAELFRSAKRGLVQLRGEAAKINGKKPQHETSASSKDIKNCGEILDLLGDFREGREWPSDAELEPMRRLSEKASLDMLEIFLGNSSEILEKLTLGERVPPKEIRTLLAFFKFRTKNALSELSTPRSGCF